MTIERGPDRRVAHRRREEALVHYAGEALIGAALALADEPSGELSRALREAASAYRAAVDGLGDRPPHRAPGESYDHVLCEECEEATLGPDDHRCPNDDCPSHDR